MNLSYLSFQYFVIKLSFSDLLNNFSGVIFSISHLNILVHFDQTIFSNNNSCCLGERFFTLTLLIDQSGDFSCKTYSFHSFFSLTVFPSSSNSLFLDKEFNFAKLSL
jgi:hypothetical protein